MPLTKAGAEVLKRFKKEYGDKEGEARFYASMNAKRLDATKMEAKGGAIRKRQST